ncbi:MAG: carotenoid oxygenase family protein [Myxococcota bacterium]
MTLSRRVLIEGLAAGASLVALPRIASAKKHIAEQCYLEFKSRVKSDPELDPWRSVPAKEFSSIGMTVDGALPKALRGTLYRNGPAGFERAGARYQHWFDGDGMVQAFRIADGKIHHRGRKVATRKWVAEEKAGRFLVPGAGSSVPDPKGVPGNGNPANISVVPWGEELLALWEAGSPYALDPESLETRRRVVFSEDSDGMPFSAHPQFEADGRMWNFGLAQWAGKNGLLALYALSPGKGLERTTMVELPFPGYMHSFVMSNRWLVFYLVPHVFNRAQAKTYVDAHRWEPQRGGKILLVDKNDFSKRRWLDAPAGFVWHYADATDQKDGGLRIRAAWADAPKTMDEEMYGVMCGKTSTVDAHTALATLTVSSSGTVRVERSELAGEFPIADTRGTSPFMVMAHEFSLNMINRQGRQKTLRAPGRIKLEEHLFVPRSARLGDGWLVGTGYDLDARSSVVTVFDTESESAAPVALARMNRRIPFGFHGWFLKA